MVTNDSFLVQQLASAGFNDYILENFRLNRATTPVTVRVANIVGNDQSEPSNSANIDQKFVYMTSKSHGAPWVRHTIIPNGGIFVAPVGTEQFAIEGILEELVTNGTIRQDSNGNYFINTIVPSYNYQSEPWRE